MSATVERQLRIGEVAELTGTAPRTIRYYEEIGLLPGSTDRAQGKHRLYTEEWPRPRVASLAKIVDTKGRVIVCTTSLERAELKRDQIHAYGPDPRIPRCSGSMTAEIEPAE